MGYITQSCNALWKSHCAHVGSLITFVNLILHHLLSRDRISLSVLYLEIKKPGSKLDLNFAWCMVFMKSFHLFPPIFCLYYTYNWFSFEMLCYIASVGLISYIVTNQDSYDQFKHLIPHFHSLVKWWQWFWGQAFHNKVENFVIVSVSSFLCFQFLCSLWLLHS